MYWLTFFVILFMLVLAILAIILAVITLKTQYTPPPVNSNQEYAASLSPYTWGPEVPQTPCGLYTFPFIDLTINSQSYVAAPNPTLNTAILNTLTPSTTLPSCYDQDQIIAQSVTRTCQGFTGITGTTISLCYDLNGNLQPPGAIETYYSNLSCTTPPCQGILSLVNLDSNSTNNLCLTKTGANYGCSGLVAINNCDITDYDQIFRITRLNLNPIGSETTTATVTGNGVLGPVAQIFDRDTGNCLETNSSNQLIITTCSANSGGFDWLLVPSFTTTSGTVTPQQLAYVNGINPNDIPTFNTPAFEEWLTSNSIQSITLDSGPCTSQTPTLAPFVFDVTSDSTPTAQFLNIYGANSLETLPVCTVGGPVPCNSF